MNPKSHSSYYWYAVEILRNHRGEESRRVDVGLLSWREVCAERREGKELFLTRGPAVIDHDREISRAAVEAVAKLREA
jgi:hypothetical protein